MRKGFYVVWKETRRSNVSEALGWLGGCSHAPEYFKEV